MKIRLPSPVIPLSGPLIFGNNEVENNAFQNNISVYCKRDDLIHPIISGNKWRKLSTTLQMLQQSKFSHVLSFGGPYSNHLHALSYACAALNIKLTAIVRGNYHKNLSPTLQDMHSWGTHLKFVSNADYKRRNEQSYCLSLQHQLHADFLIPEGGSHFQALSGVEGILSEVRLQVPNITHIVLPVASAGTLAGLLASELLPQVKLVGIGVLKGFGYLESLVENLLNQNPLIESENQAIQTAAKTKQWEINHQFHHGGYAKSSQKLEQFVSDFNDYFDRQHNQTTNALSPNLPPLFQTNRFPLKIEPIYSGKCFYALQRLLANNYFEPNSNILILHTGGLQGARK
jgi:1-aminocyclopropane-1-carboxylate deaminase